LTQRELERRHAEKSWRLHIGVAGFGHRSVRFIALFSGVGLLISLLIVICRMHGIF